LQYKEVDKIKNLDLMLLLLILPIQKKIASKMKAILIHD